MKQANKQKLPPGWTAKKVRAVIAHYDQQSEDEGAVEIESAPEAPETLMAVPVELVGVVTRLIKDHAKKQRNGKAKPGRA